MITKRWIVRWAYMDATESETQADMYTSESKACSHYLNRSALCGTGEVEFVTYYRIELGETHDECSMVVMSHIVGVKPKIVEYNKMAKKPPESAPVMYTDGLPIINVADEQLFHTFLTEF